MIRTAGNRPAWRLGMTLVRSGGNHAIRGKPCSRVRTSAANPCAPCGPPRLPARRPSRDRPLRKARLYKRGPFSAGSLPPRRCCGLPAPAVPPGSLTPCRTRPWHDIGCFAEEQIVFRSGIFPETTGEECLGGRITDQGLPSPALARSLVEILPRLCPVRRTGGRNRATLPAAGKSSSVSRRRSYLESTGGIPDALPPRRLLQHLRMFDDRFRVVFETCRLLGASGSNLRDNGVALIVLHVGPP